MKKLMFTIIIMFMVGCSDNTTSPQIPYNKTFKFCNDNVTIQDSRRYSYNYDFKEDMHTLNVVLDSVVEVDTKTEAWGVITFYHCHDEISDIEIEISTLYGVEPGRIVAMRRGLEEIPVIDDKYSVYLENCLSQ